jgi:GGDEF domain-containing protein
LTGLLNRLALRDRLASEISSAAATGVLVALLMLDLDISN